MLVILDYGAGNLTSVRLAFERLGVEAVVASEASAAAGAARLVFPGVGSAGSGMAGVRQRGFDRLLREAHATGTPILGICLGMQLLLEESAEDGGQAGVGLLSGRVVEFAFPAAARVKIPQMGWNAVRQRQRHPLWSGIADDEAFYFVHSYYACPADLAVTAGETEYGGLEFASALASGSLFAVQFHPERSGEAGLRLLRNFVDWSGA